ncbi:hypothetical protein AM571_PA00312 (plasmid) [Rhizobium etli 8C-3]|uniref:Uncharacterized protein n=1 Tax=Rhizobium etli 8C-3 TaxID=538025 RepID=A0A1L5PAQ8_RHIET|nr:hypothetical protein AM571_PA00312 [Rhizobium etli 8C-3]
MGGENSKLWHLLRPIPDEIATELVVPAEIDYEKGLYAPPGLPLKSLGKPSNISPPRSTPKPREVSSSCVRADASHAPEGAAPCRIRSSIKTLRSRTIRRRSSSSGVGTGSIGPTRGPPRLKASNAGSASPIEPVRLARRRQRDVDIAAASTTWLL